MKVTALLRSRAFQTMLGIAVSLAVILWMVLTVEWEKVFHEMSKIRYGYLVPALFVIVAHVFIRAWRWRYLLPEPPRARLIDLYNAIMIGTFATFVLPLRAGEFVRPYYLSKKSGHRFSVGFVSVVIERFFDLSAVLISFGLMVAYLPGVPDLARKGALSLSVLAAGLLLFMLVGALAPDFVLRACRAILGLFPGSIGGPILKFIEGLLDGTRVLRSTGHLVMVVGITVLVWSSCYYLYYLFLLMFETEASAWLSMSIAVMIALAVAAPSAPGFLGVYQAGCLAAFALFGIDEAVAVAYSLVTHVVQFVFGVSYGLAILSFGGLKLSELRSGHVPETSSTVPGPA